MTPALTAQLQPLSVRPALTVQGHANDQNNVCAKIHCDHTWRHWVFRVFVSVSFVFVYVPMVAVVCVCVCVFAY